MGLASTRVTAGDVAGRCRGTTSGLAVPLRTEQWLAWGGSVSSQRLTRREPLPRPWEACARSVGNLREDRGKAPGAVGAQWAHGLCAPSLQLNSLRPLQQAQQSCGRVRHHGDQRGHEVVTGRPMCYPRSARGSASSDVMSSCAIWRMVTWTGIGRCSPSIRAGSRPRLISS